MFCGKCGFNITDNEAAFCPQCGTPVAAPVQAENLQQKITPMADCPYNISGIWPEWTPVKQIGKGSFGVVYEAVRNDSHVESRAAIKVISVPADVSELDSLRSEGLDAGRSRAYFKDIVDDFVREIQVMESLKGLANIVNVEDYKVVEKTNDIGYEIYIRMELLTPLNTYLCDKKLSENEVIALGMDICTALEYCAKRNIIHRDIKPENIFINDLGCYKLGDFGIAKRLENMSDALTHQKGTLNYMAPEVALNKEYDSRVDLYSLGLVLYKLLNGNILPFLDPNKQLLTAGERKNAVDRRLKGEPIPAPINASTEMADLVLCVCEHDPKLRYATAAEMKKGLQSILDKNYVPYTPQKKKNNKAAAPVIKPVDEIPLKDKMNSAPVSSFAANFAASEINRKPDDFVPVIPAGGISRVMNDQPPPSVMTAPESPVHHKKGGNKAGLIIGIIAGVLLFIACVVAAVFFILSALDKDKNPGEATTAVEITTEEEPATEEFVTEEVSLEPEPIEDPEVITTIVYQTDPNNGGNSAPIIIIVEGTTEEKPTRENPTTPTKAPDTTKTPETTRAPEPTQPVPQMPSTKTEVINFFKNSASSIKNSASAGFTRKQWHTVDEVNTGYGLANSILLSALEKLMKSEDGAKEKTASKGSSLAKEIFPGWALTDSSKVSSATCSKSGSDYLITIKMKDEDTPSKSGALSKVSNSIVYLQDIESGLASYLDDYSDVHIIYRNYTITAVVSPDGKFKSIDHKAEMEISIGEITIKGITLNNIKGYMTCNCKYYNFSY